MDIVLWFALFLVFLAVEAATVGLVSVWFAVGSLFGLLAAALGATLPLQIIVAVVVSGVALWAVRPLAKKYLIPKQIKTNVETVPGQEAVVTEEINNLQATGAVKLGALTWTARSEDGGIIPVGTVVRVSRVEGVKLLVTPATAAAEKA